MANYQITASESEATKIQANAAASINAGAVISVFGIHLMGAVEKYKYKVNEGEEEKEYARILVCPSTENPKQSVSLESICGEVGIGEDKKKSINDVMKFLGFAGGVKETYVDVYQAFFYYSGKDDDKAGKNKDIDKEYAFSLGITNKYEPEYTDPKPPFSIESISFSLWNSTREKIINSLGTYSIEDMLQKLS